MDIQHLPLDKQLIVIFELITVEHEIADTLTTPSSYFLRTTVPFVTAHLEIFHCTHHPVIPKSDLYFTFCSTLNTLSKRTSK